MGIPKFQRRLCRGGVTANINFFEPYPVVMKSGNGAYLTDVDGNEYIDYLFNVVITEKEHVRNYRDLKASNFKVRKDLDYHLLTQGIYIQNRSIAIVCQRSMGQKKLNEHLKHMEIY